MEITRPIKNNKLHKDIAKLRRLLVNWKKLHSLPGIDENVKKLDKASKVLGEAERLYHEVEEFLLSKSSDAPRRILKVSKSAD